MGLQVASVSGTFKNGSNSLVLNGLYTPGGNSYYASIDYESSAFNSPTTQLFPDLPFLSNAISSVSSANFYQTTNTAVFFDNSFYWRGTVTTEFVYYGPNVSATYTIANITGSTSYPIVNQTFTLTPGNNRIQIVSLDIVQIPESSSRTSVPYNSPETLSSVVTIGGVPYSLQNILFSPALIRDVVISMIGSYWDRSQLYQRYVAAYYYADGSRSTTSRSGDLRNILRLYKLNSGQSTLLESYPQDVNNVPQVYRSEEVVIIPFSSLGSDYYYITVEHDDPSFTSRVITASSAVQPLIPDYASPPLITSISNIRIDSSGLLETLDPSGLVADFTVTLDYQPPNSLETSVPLSLLRLGTILYANQPIVRGVNNIVFTRAVIPGGYYAVSVGEGLGKVSTSVPFLAPNYGLLSFTRVPASVSITRPTYPPFTITVQWQNTIPGYSGGDITIATVGLFISGLDSSLDSSITHTPVGGGADVTLTFTITPSNLTIGNQIEINLGRSVSLSGGFSSFQFQITDVATGISVLSSAIRCA